MAMMYPMKGLSCTGVTCPLAIPLATGVSGLQGTVVLGPPLGMRTGLLARFSSAAEPLAIGVWSNEGGEQGREKAVHPRQIAKTKCEGTRRTCECG